MTRPGRLLRRVEVDGRVVDVRVTGDRVAEVAGGLRPRPGEEVVDGGGGALLPGLHDHHLHLLAMAAARTSVSLGPPEVTDPAGLDAAVRRAHAAAPDDRWIRATGYDETVGGALDRDRLDRLAPGRAIRVQHASGAAWIVSTAGLMALGLLEAPDEAVERDAAGRPTGRLFRLDALLRARIPADEPDLRAVADRLLGYGVTGVTDATATTDPAYLSLLSDAVTDGRLRMRVAVTGGPVLAGQHQAALQTGPVKLVFSDHDLPGMDQALEEFAAARRASRPIAVHCVTRASLALALACWDAMAAVPGDRIEHASVAPPELVERIAALGLTVVTQPSFVALRGDRYLDHVDPEDQPYLYPLRSLLAAGVPVAASSDAPYGDADPWRGIAAAVQRRTASGRVVAGHERLGAQDALPLYLAPLEAPGGPPRRVVPGARADLCLLDAPLVDVLAAPSADRIVATMYAGEVVAGRSDLTG